jgi:hypothetical protein
MYKPLFISITINQAWLRQAPMGSWPIDQLVLLRNLYISKAKEHL